MNDKKNAWLWVSLVSAVALVGLVRKVLDDVRFSIPVSPDNLVIESASESDITTDDVNGASETNFVKNIRLTDKPLNGIVAPLHTLQLKAQQPISDPSSLELDSALREITPPSPLELWPLSTETQTPMPYSPSKNEVDVIDKAWGAVAKESRLALNVNLLKFGILLTVPSNASREFCDSKALYGAVPIPPPGKTTHARSKNTNTSDAAKATVGSNEKAIAVAGGLGKSPKFVFGSRSFSVEQVAFEKKTFQENVGCGAWQNIFSEFLVANKAKNSNVQSSNILSETEEKKLTGIYRAENRDEKFFPTLVGFDKSNNPVGLYSYMWSSDPERVTWHPKNKKSLQVFSGFETFVSAMCMFGTHLVGCNQAGVQRPLIKHDNEYFDGEKIQSVYTLQDSNPYETLAFKDLNMYLYMVDNYTKNGARKTFVCHVPWADYMLIGIDLYLKNRITLSALGQFFKLILKKGKEYKEKIEAVCAAHNIHVEILSPLSSLFTNTMISIDNSGTKFTKVQRDRESKSYEDFAKAVLKDLGLDSVDDTKQSSLYLTKDAEVPMPVAADDSKSSQMKSFVNGLISKLRTAQNPHSPLWNKILASDSIVKKIETIEGLFDIANAFVVAYATDGKARDSVCSILPLSEKPIQIEYKKLAGELSLPAVFFVTMLDSMMAYDQKNNTGLLFYHQNNYNDLEKLIIGDTVKILHEARNIVGFFAQHQRNCPSPTIHNISSYNCLESSFLVDSLRGVMVEAKKTSQNTAASKF